MRRDGDNICASMSSPCGNIVGGENDNRYSYTSNIKNNPDGLNEYHITCTLCGTNEIRNDAEDKPYECVCDTDYVRVEDDLGNNLGCRHKNNICTSTNHYYTSNASGVYNCTQCGDSDATGG